MHQPIHPDVLHRLDPEYVPFHNEHIAPVVPHTIPWHSDIHKLPVVPGSSPVVQASPRLAGLSLHPRRFGSSFAVVHYRTDATHQGGWTLGSLATQASFPARQCKEHRCLTVCLDYRLAPENPYPAAVVDTVDTLKWIHQHGQSELIANVNKIAVDGSSSGGNLAAIVSLKAQQLNPPIPILFQLLVVPGHEVVATIAQMHLHPSVMPKLCAILDYDGECHLAPVATWADRIRREAKYRWTGPLHYINAVDDYLSATCTFPGPGGWQGRTHINVLNAIRNTTTVLQEFEGQRASAGVSFDDTDVPGYVQDALKFLIHFIGDMHMPLHLTGRNCGGNGDKVAFDGRTTNLHSVWDSLLISEHVEAYLRGTIYDPYIRRLVWEGILGRWQDEQVTWLTCPASDSSTPPSSSSPQRQHQLASTWQSVLSLFNLASASTSTGEGEDPLGVDDDILCLYAWAKPIQQLNCELIFPKELDDFVPPHSSFDLGDEECACGDDEDALAALARKRKKSPYLELYTPDYAGVIKEQWIVEKLLTQAGTRLAADLNWIFAELDEDESRGGYLTL
ncbi:S1/P1 nuclease-domain-containing protein [Boletus reticuloceps]|uniref:S1/P1 nuclease-domain-containing protein n=1 Tax=Boletus reticuloceps TaxID=495285 RepID=A0A8I2YGZ0_9AGAM|nr:S1/P1 nuclease-domain-containing protein [Boletus reticuloceps]